MIAATFWLTKFDNNVTILQALLNTGRYPASVYPYWLRMIITFLVPVAVATTVPLQALRGELGLGQIVFFLGISAASFSGRLAGWKNRGKEVLGRVQVNWSVEAGFMRTRHYIRCVRPFFHSP